jgi:hypothetical protein
MTIGEREAYATLKNALTALIIYMRTYYEVNGDERVLKQAKKAQRELDKANEQFKKWKRVKNESNCN